MDGSWTLSSSCNIQGSFPTKLNLQSLPTKFCIKRSVAGQSFLTTSNFCGMIWVLLHSSLWPFFKKQKNWISLVQKHNFTHTLPWNLLGSSLPIFRLPTGRCCLCCFFSSSSSPPHHATRNRVSASPYLEHQISANVLLTYKTQEKIHEPSGVSCKFTSVIWSLADLTSLSPSKRTRGFTSSATSCSQLASRKREVSAWHAPILNFGQSCLPKVGDGAYRALTCLVGEGGGQAKASSLHGAPASFPSSVPEGSFAPHDYVGAGGGGGLATQQWWLGHKATSIPVWSLAALASMEERNKGCPGQCPIRLGQGPILV